MLNGTVNLPNFVVLNPWRKPAVTEPKTGDRNLPLARQELGLGQQLVAESCADCDLVTTLGATAAQDGGTGLGLHAGEKAVGLGPVAAVGLEGTLRHDKNSCAGDCSCSNF